MADPLPDLLQAIREGDDAAALRLLQDDPSLAEAGDEAGVSYLLHSLYHRRLEVAQEILNHRSAVDLFEASALGLEDVVSARMGEAPEAAGAFAPDGFTPLHLASFFGQESTVAALLDAGADPNVEARNESQLRPIHGAAASGSPEILRRLLEAGADPDARQKGGFTALHSAARHGDEAMARLLLDKGADPSVEDDEGNTALDHARQGEGEEEVLPLLEKAGAGG